MQARRSYLSTGKQIVDACFARDVGLHSANHIMGTRPDGNQIPADIYIETFTQLENMGEPFLKMYLIEVTNI